MTGDPQRNRSNARRAATRPLDATTVANAADDAFKRLVHEMAGLIDGSLRYLHLAQRELGIEEPGPGQHYLDSAEDALARVASLIRDSTSIVGGDSSVPIGRSLSGGRSLAEVIAHAVDVVRPVANEWGISVRSRVADDLDRIKPMPLYPVIANGLRNAIEACETDGHVGLDAMLLVNEQGGHEVRIDISDDGPGPPDTASRAFEPGFTTKAGGFGIGLSIARDIVTELGGSISLVRRDQGGGAVLAIRTPVPASAMLGEGRGEA